MSSKAMSYLKLFNKLCVRTQAFRYINLIDQGFSFLFRIPKLIEIISVYFNTLTSDSYYQATLFIFFFCREEEFQVKVLSTHKALT